MILHPTSVCLDAHAADAEDAIRQAGGLLVRAAAAADDYVEAMVQGYRTLGPYIVIAPQVAMPHARPDAGGLGSGLALLRLAEPVVFGHPENDPVRVVIPIVAVDPGVHIDLLRALSTTLVQPDAMRTILTSNDPQEIATLFTTQEGNHQ